MTKEEELNNIKYWVCCALCDNERCVKDTDNCEAEQWLKRKVAEISMVRRKINGDSN